MKKVIIFLCFGISASLVAADANWKVLPEVKDTANYVYDNVSSTLKVINNQQDLFKRAYNNCTFNALVSPRCVQLTYGAILNVGYKKGLQNSTLKDVVMSSTTTQKCGYACIVVFAGYGAVQVAFAIRKMFRKDGDQE